MIRRTTLQLEAGGIRPADPGRADRAGTAAGTDGRASRGGGARCRRDPRWTWRVQKTELVRLFPAVRRRCPRTQRARLAAQLRTVYAAPGDVLMRRDERPRRVWFIASGAVESVQAGQKNRLGRGEMFGQLSVLLGQAASRTGDGDHALHAADAGRDRLSGAGPRQSGLCRGRATGRRQAGREDRHRSAGSRQRPHAAGADASFALRKGRRAIAGLGMHSSSQACTERMALRSIWALFALTVIPTS